MANMWRNTVNQPDFSTKEQPSFFKIYTPQLASDKLRIPPAFIENLEGQIPSQALLKNVKGDVWPVKLVKANGYLYMTDGWKDYASDHSLEHGNFLVFSYGGNSVFRVKVFGLNGYIQEEPSNGDSLHPYSSAIVEYKNDSLQPYSSEIVEYIYDKDTARNDSPVSNIRFVKTFGPSCSNYVSMPADIMRGINITLPSMIVLQGENGSSVTTALRKMSDRVVVGYAGLSAFWRAIKVKDGDKMEFEIRFGTNQNISILVKISPKQRQGARRSNGRSRKS